MVCNFGSNHLYGIHITALKVNNYNKINYFNTRRIGIILNIYIGEPRLRELSYFVNSFLFFVTNILKYAIFIVVTYLMTLFHMTKAGESCGKDIQL